MEFVLYLSVALVAYLFGSIPTGFLLGKARGIDIRTVGSGNIGATNVFRMLGKPAGIAVLAVDALKGYVACALVGTFVCRLGAPWLNAPRDAAVLERFAIVAGIAALLGHNYTCWLRFKGGKGIATSAGVLVALLPKALLIILGIWILVFAASRYVSLASISAAFSLPFAAWLVGQSKLKMAVAAAMSVLAIYKHRSNIQRLIQGTENRVTLKKAPTSTHSTP